MRVYIRRNKGNIDAVGEYDVHTKKLIVLKGSRVSEKVAHSETFRGAKSIEKARQLYVVDNRVKENVCFKSASTAANFVTGVSTNGLKAWKDENGLTIKMHQEEAN